MWAPTWEAERVGVIQKWVIVTGEMGTQVRWDQGPGELGRAEVRFVNPGELMQEPAGLCGLQVPGTAGSLTWHTKSGVRC